MAIKLAKWDREGIRRENRRETKERKGDEEERGGKKAEKEK